MNEDEGLKMNKVKYLVGGLLGGWLLLGVGALGAAKLGLIPANADSSPGKAEHFFAQMALNAWLDHNSPSQENPVALNDQNLRDGMKVYSNNCAGCHGDAKGKSEFGRAFYPPTPQFTSGRVPHDPDAVLYTMASRGIRLTGMPSFKTLLKEDEIWKAVLFIKHLNELPPAVQSDWKNPPP